MKWPDELFDAMEKVGWIRQNVWFSKRKNHDDSLDSAAKQQGFIHTFAVTGSEFEALIGLGEYVGPFVMYRQQRKVSCTDFIIESVYTLAFKNEIDAVKARMLI